jgi:hypothetical protein
VAPKLALFNSEDMLLPGAHRKPPSPEPLTQGVATPSALAGAQRSTQWQSMPSCTMTSLRRTLVHLLLRHQKMLPCW